MFYMWCDPLSTSFLVDGSGAFMSRMLLGTFIKSFQKTIVSNVQKS